MGAPEAGPDDAEAGPDGAAGGCGATGVLAVRCFLPHAGDRMRHRVAAKVMIRFLLRRLTASILNAIRRKTQIANRGGKTIYENTFYSPFWSGPDLFETSLRIFFLTSAANNLIYESHCDLHKIANLR